MFRILIDKRTLAAIGAVLAVIFAVMTHSEGEKDVNIPGTYSFSNVDVVHSYGRAIISLENNVYRLRLSSQKAGDRCEFSGVSGDAALIDEKIAGGARNVFVRFATEDANRDDSLTLSFGLEIMTIIENDVSRSRYCQGGASIPENMLFMKNI